MTLLNLGILAHVDAGKTTLTERLLHAAGVIDEVGRVDDGTTQTDSLELERRRGITIKSAVASFAVDGVTVNLLDTPGHSDFVAEVERVLGVLDGAVLVISAVEGVQPQTLVLFRALRRLGVPTIAFVNKIDRVGADVGRVLTAVAERLEVAVLPMSSADAVGTRGATVADHDLDDPEGCDRMVEVLAEHDETILRDYLDGRPLQPERLRDALRGQIRAHHVLPAFAGVALTGVGVDTLLRAIPRLLPHAGGADDDGDGPPAGTVFKIERGRGREKLAVVRMFSGTLRTRDRIRLHPDDPHVDTVTAIDVVDRGGTRRVDAIRAGEIAKLHGLSSARIGAAFGPVRPREAQVAFARPSLETAVVPGPGSAKRHVFAALADLAEQDPLIDLRQDDARGELFLSLYGEVQKEIVAETLKGDYGLDIEFLPTTPVCIERPNGAGYAIEPIPRRRTPATPFLATIGLALRPRPAGSGVTVDLDLDVKAIPIHVFDSVDAFHAVMDRIVRDTLRQGLHGWEVTDCAVVMTDGDYQAPPRKWPGTTLSDYRLLTPLVLMAALADAGTTVLEPVLDVHLELPTGDLGPIMAVLREAGVRPGPPTSRGSVTELDGSIRAARLHELQSRIPDLTSGEGVLETASAGYRPVEGEPPERPRTDRNPLDRVDYIRRVNQGR